MEIWQDSHRKSQKIAQCAEEIRRIGLCFLANDLYYNAASFEYDAYYFLHAKQRTRKITAESLLALCRKAGNVHQTNRAVALIMNDPLLDEAFKAELREKFDLKP